MEHLFSTKISVHHESTIYQVNFDQEKYIFTPASESKTFPTFSFMREHDEWHSQEPIPHDVRKHALDALEKYLLRQH